MPTIGLTQGQRARVDWQDYRELSRHKWHALRNPKGRTLYAARMETKSEVLSVGREYSRKNKRIILMHRQLLGLGFGRRPEVDHKNRDGLDNRRANLRIVTRRKNMENRHDQSRHGLGVYEHGPGFRARVVVDKQAINLGTFVTPEEAREARAAFLRSHDLKE